MAETLQFFQQGLWLAIIVSAPPLLIATLFGVIVSLVQAITQVQDQTLPYVVKLLSVALTVAALGRWFGAEIMQLADHAFLLIPAVGR
ncbi:type III secretion system export apparatus subunit SctS [Duganella vulcania]|uniref:EscS/YscS/HrcS family type III secretion system export apparatus protein n=1 Tax=Duganella vulcania TaxID=2692166 RepID=A0A845GYR0_9BURK|nr:type III secretion system export apparatus subunit SctS [Duganella vulcania]MYM99125.1 EscS/YscS/HrcS family type III secretion system export apparatus protein [Duganella vulcania]PHV06654.1 EscS/YscS/HrcS family type III secretion system export apparatus protein [Janthinobacterium sp. BJB412]